MTTTSNPLESVSAEPDLKDYIPTVKISFEQLNAAINRKNGAKSEKTRKKSKRPDVAIYQPGQRLNARQRANAPVNDQEENNEPTTKSPDVEKADSTGSRSRTKRPEIPVYVPKRKETVKPEEQLRAASSKIEHGLSVKDKSRLEDKESALLDSHEERETKVKVSSRKKQSTSESSIKERTNSNPEECSGTLPSKESKSQAPERSRKPTGKPENKSASANKGNRFYETSKSGVQDATSRSSSDKRPVGNNRSKANQSNLSRGSSGQKKQTGAPQRKTVTFDNGDVPQNDINLDELQDSIKEFEDAETVSAHDKHNKPRELQTRNTSSRTRKQPSGQSSNNRDEQANRSKSNTQHKSRHSKQAVEDSRLYDPYSDSKKKDGNQAQVKGLIKLPTSTMSGSSQLSPSCRMGGGALFNPDDPSKPIKIQTDSTEYRSLGPSISDSWSGSNMLYPSSDPSYTSGMMATPGVMPAMYPPGYPPHASYFNPGSYNNYGITDEGYQAEEASKHKVSLLIRDIVPLDRQLQAILSRRLETGSMDHFHRLRITVRDKLEQIILLDLQYSVNHNVDQLLWKSIYHNVLENLRSDLQEEGCPETRNQISSLLDEAGGFYEEFLGKLERHNKFTLSDYTCPHRNQALSRSIKFALFMSQRLLICLGDVARYRTQNDGSSDYGRSRHYYLKASYVYPKNGKPYNQLAIIAMSAKRKLDTVFYFMRSIAASNAFLSAKESLRAIYNDVIKKYDYMKQQAEKIKSQRQIRQANRQNSRSNLNQYKRIEIWISPIDGSSVTDHVDDEKDVDNPAKMPCNELYKRFMTTFLCCQGMVFSKVVMEHFPDASSEALHLLKALLNHSPVPLIDVTKFVQIFAICMFSIQHAGMQVNPTSLETEKCRSYTQEQAVLLHLDMLIVVIDRCSTLLSAHNKVLYSQLMSHDLVLLLPIIRLVADWMTCHPHLWNPPPCPRDPALGPVLDPWQAISNFSNILSQLNIHHVKFYSADEVPDDLEGFTWLQLPEEVNLKGFLPLMNLSVEEVFVKSDVDQVEAAQCYRVSKLITFADYLCGVEPPMLDFNTHSAKYSSLIEPPSLSEKSSELPRKRESDEELSDVESDRSVSEDESVSGVDDEVSELRRTKKELSRQLALQQKQQQAHQAALEREDHLIQLEVRPIYLVPDTNCFIEYLTQMQKLITLKKFTVVIPLVVINELDGLAKNAHTDKYNDLEHGKLVQEEARKAVEFLEFQFESRNSRLRALTMSGTELDTITYRSEESTTLGTNDDKILSCCLHYCTDNARDFMPKNGENVINLVREIVLLTDDRNLRLKAHTRNVPVKDLLQFLSWAKLN